MKITLLLLLVMGLGCSTAKLQPDPVVVPALAANYPQLEISACGKKWNGLAMCSVKAGEPLESIKLKVQGYFSGTIKIDSKRCGIDTSVSYWDSEEIAIPLHGKATTDCVVTMTLEPIYPVKDTSEEKIENFRGHLAIKVLKKDRPWVGTTRKLTGNWDSFVDIPVKEAGENARIVYSGCGVDHDGAIFAEALWADFELKDAVAGSGVSRCILDGFVQQGSFVAQFDVFIAQYQPLFAQLPTPNALLDGTTLIVTADSAVSVIALDGDYRIANEVKFKGFNPKVNHILRLFTTAGRLVIGEWLAGGNFWEWKQ